MGRGAALLGAASHLAALAHDVTPPGIGHAPENGAREPVTPFETASAAKSDYAANLACGGMQPGVQEFGRSDFGALKSSSIAKERTEKRRAREETWRALRSRPLFILSVAKSDHAANLAFGGVQRAYKSLGGQNR